MGDESIAVIIGMMILSVIFIIKRIFQRLYIIYVKKRKEGLKITLQQDGDKV